MKTQKQFLISDFRLPIAVPKLRNQKPEIRDALIKLSFRRKPESRFEKASAVRPILDAGFAGMTTLLLVQSFLRN